MMHFFICACCPVVSAHAAVGIIYPAIFYLITCLSIAKDTNVPTIQCSMQKSRYLSIKFSFLKKGRMRHRGTVCYQERFDRWPDSPTSSKKNIDRHRPARKIDQYTRQQDVIANDGADHPQCKSVERNTLKRPDEYRIITMIGEVEKEYFVIGTLNTYGSATGSYGPIHCVPVVLQETVSMRED